MIAHADNFTSLKLDDVIALHETRPKHAQITMPLFRSETPENCGIVRINQKGIVVDYQEKPREPLSNLANTALYILDDSAISEILKMDRSNTDLSTDIIPRFVNRIFGFQIDGFHIDIGTLENLKLANELANVSASTARI